MSDTALEVSPIFYISFLILFQKQLLADYLDESW